MARAARPRPETHAGIRPDWTCLVKGAKRRCAVRTLDETSPVWRPAWQGFQGWLCPATGGAGSEDQPTPPCQALSDGSLSPLISSYFATARPKMYLTLYRVRSGRVIRQALTKRYAHRPPELNHVQSIACSANRSGRCLCCLFDPWCQWRRSRGALGRIDIQRIQIMALASWTKLKK